MLDKIPFHTLRNGGLALFIALIATVAVTGLMLGRQGETHLKTILENNDRQATLIQIRGDLLQAHALYDYIVSRRKGGHLDLEDLLASLERVSAKLSGHAQSQELREYGQHAAKQLTAIRLAYEQRSTFEGEVCNTRTIPLNMATQALQDLAGSESFVSAFINDLDVGQLAPVFLAHTERLALALDSGECFEANPTNVAILMTQALDSIHDLRASHRDEAFQRSMQSIDVQTAQLSADLLRVLKLQKATAEDSPLPEELLLIEQRWGNLERNLDGVIAAANLSMFDHGKVISSEWKDGLAFTLTFFAGLIAVSIALSYVLHRSLHNRVDSLVQGARSLSKGDTSHRIETASRDQLSKVAIYFNHMARRLQRKERQLGQAFEDIKTANANLERRVHMRTLELEQANSDLAMMGKIFQHSAEGILVTDLSGTIFDVNPAFTRITGYTYQEALGQTPSILKSGRYDQEFYENMWGSLCSENGWKGEIWNRRKNGNIYPQTTSISCLQNAEGEAIGYVAIFSDVSDRKRKEEIIRRQALHDHLTGLPNRAFFMEQLESAVRRASDMQHNLALLFIDLDDFKIINDTLGHKAGDVVLQTIAKRMESVFRSSDILCRLGGDEFVVLMNEFNDVGVVQQVTARALNLLLRPIVLDGAEATVSVSIGAAIFPEDADKPEALLEKSDAAMYFAKRQGKGTVAFHHEIEEAQ